MKIQWIRVVLICLVSGRAVAADFCEGAKFVPLDQLLTKQEEFIGKRIQTKAIFSTDAKEYTRISFAEKSNFSILTTADDESTAYSQRHDQLTHPPFGVIDDLFKKLREVEGPKYKKDMSKIRYYRQDVEACGRLVKKYGELRFAMDDAHIERTYLVPW